MQSIMLVYNFTSLLICNIEHHSTLVNVLCRIFCEHLYSVLVLVQNLLLTQSLNTQMWLNTIVIKYIYIFIKLTRSFIPFLAQISVKVITITIPQLRKMSALRVIPGCRLNSHIYYCDSDPHFSYQKKKCFGQYYVLGMQQE